MTPNKGTNNSKKKIEVTPKTVELTHRKSQNDSFEELGHGYSLRSVVFKRLSKELKWTFMKGRNYPWEV